MRMHSRWAHPSCRVGAVPLGPGIVRYHSVDGDFDLGEAVSDPDARRPAPVWPTPAFTSALARSLPGRPGCER